MSDLEVNISDFSKYVPLLTKHLNTTFRVGNVELTSTYTDCHVYLMDQRILELLGSFVSETENFSDERLVQFYLPN